MTKEQREHRKKVIAAGIAFYALGNRNASTLKRVVRAGALGILANGGTVDHVAMAVYLVTRTAAGRIRTGARLRARIAWRQTTGITVAATDTRLTDHQHAERAAQGMHKTFGRMLQTELAAADTEREAIYGALDALDPSFERTGVTETFDALNDETAALNTFAAGLGYVIVETWEAMLDTRTCDECAAMDGKTVVRPERFPEYPPAHNRCRCYVSTQALSAIDELAS